MKEYFIIILHVLTLSSFTSLLELISFTGSYSACADNKTVQYIRVQSCFLAKEFLEVYLLVKVPYSFSLFHTI